MKKLLNLLLLNVFALCVFVSCADDGKDGEQGLPGNANVIYSDWFMPGTEYTTTMVHGIRTFRYSKDAPEITQEVLDKGVVLAFANLDGYTTNIWPDGQVSVMPISFTYMQGGQTMEDTWSAVASVGKITISFVNDKNEYIAPSSMHKFRYVVIPANVAGKNSIDYTKMTYQEVCQHFNIPN